MDNPASDIFHHEAQGFKVLYDWLALHMPPFFLEECNPDMRAIIARSLMSFNLQGRFIIARFDHCILGIMDNCPDSDLRMMKEIGYQSFHSYQIFQANAPLPGEREAFPLKVVLIRTCSSHISCKDHSLEALSEKRHKILSSLEEQLTDSDIGQIDLKVDHSIQDPHLPSIQLLAAFRLPPRAGLLKRIFHLIFRYQLSPVRAYLSYSHSEKGPSILLISLGLRPIQSNQDLYRSEILDSFCEELSTLRHFDERHPLMHFFEKNSSLTLSERQLLFALSVATHQMLLQSDPTLFSKQHIDEAFMHYPEYAAALCHIFKARLHPKLHNLATAQKMALDLCSKVSKIDTGNTILDRRRKIVLEMAVQIVMHTLKTTAYCPKREAIGFRFDPKIMEKIPALSQERFPTLPYGIFLLVNSYLTAYNIRFTDLARGGVRTIVPMKEEAALWEHNNLFSEAYNLALTQQKKNKDIPEGGAKSVILVNIHPTFQEESLAEIEDLSRQKQPPDFIEKRLLTLKGEVRNILLLECQRSFTRTLLQMINCDSHGKLKDLHIVDLFKKPEYLYLGPDENMSNSMIEWMALFSQKVGYPLGSALISSKPKAGINHKEYGVTSLGVHVYVVKVLKTLGIDPAKQPFTIKMSGGPDGDVAGNEILNFYRDFPQTARLIALTDGTGTVYEPLGLDLSILARFFKEGKGIAFYPPEKLTEGGFLLDLQSNVEEEKGIIRKICYKHKNGHLVKELLSSDQAQQIFGTNVHSTKADIFIPAGGRPRTLNLSNVKDFFDSEDKPTSLAIVEGANLYLTQEARDVLEKAGVLIIKDSSANKCGVICSSHEVLLSLLIPEAIFIENKPLIMKEVLADLRLKASLEADLLLNTHQKNGKPLTEISNQISEKINFYAENLLHYLENIPIPPLLTPLLDHYFIPFIQQRAKEKILTHVPSIHLKAILASMIASHLVYQKGVDWAPGIVEILPQLVKDEWLKQ